MKNLFLPLFITCALGANAQSAGQWLSLTPVSIEKPAFGNTQNVKNKTFTDALLFENSSINIRTLVPDADKDENSIKGLRWSLATQTGDTVTATENKGGHTLNYYAIYLNNDEWLKGQLEFQLFGNAEIYVDGVKKVSTSDNKPSTQTISQDWIPGKHTILVKTTTQGGKLFAARFNADKNFKNIPVTFNISPKRGENIYDILNGKRVNRLEISPTSKYAIVGITNTVNGQNYYTTTIYRVTDKEIVYSFYGNSVSNLKWIPGKDQLSFTQKEDGANTLFCYDIEQQQQSVLFQEDLNINGYIWSPDHSYLIYTTTENFSESKWQLRKLAGIEDRQDYFRYRTYLCKYEFATGLHSRLTWGNQSSSLMDISKDGQKILVGTSRPDYIEYPFNKQSIYLIDVKTMQVDTLWKDRLYSIWCRFSPDGKKLLASGGPSAFGKLGENIGKNPIANQYDTQLYIYDLATKQVDPITKNFNPSVEDAVWHKNGTIYIKATDADFIRLYKYADGKFNRIECPGDLILQTSFPEDGKRMIYTASDASYPARIYTLDLSNDQAELWESPQRSQYENIVFGEMKDWDYNYKKGTVIDGRYYLPVNFDPNKKYPLIVYYYGGTTPVARTFGGRWPFNLYAANGYVVYVMQPSGAIGYGQEFSARHQNNWGKVTADEIISSTKAFVKAHPFIDAARIGCMGASYGGFTTQYLTTQTDIFACAISHAGISSLAGYWGEGYWGYAYSTNASAHSYPWNRKDLYVDQSPLFNADKIHTPILLIHGTKDVNVPTGQSIQLYTALKLQGKDAELVLVKDADHAVVDYNQRILWNNTILSYFAKYLKGQPAWWENIYKDLNL